MVEKNRCFPHLSLLKDRHSCVKDRTCLGIQIMIHGLLMVSLIFVLIIVIFIIIIIILLYIFFKDIACPGIGKMMEG